MSGCCRCFLCIFLYDLQKHKDTVAPQIESNGYNDLNFQKRTQSCEDSFEYYAQLLARVLAETFNGLFWYRSEKRHFQ